MGLRSRVGNLLIHSPDLRLQEINLGQTVAHSIKVSWALARMDRDRLRVARTDYMAQPRSPTLLSDDLSQLDQRLRPLQHWGCTSAMMARAR